MSWPGVFKARGRFGAATLRVGRRELEHLHGDAIANIPLPRSLRDQLVRERKALAHRWLPNSGWVTVPLADHAAVASVIERAVRSASSAQPDDRPLEVREFRR